MKKKDVKKEKEMKYDIIRMITNTIGIILMFLAVLSFVNIKIPADVCYCPPNAMCSCDSFGYFLPTIGFFALGLIFVVWAYFGESEFWD